MAGENKSLFTLHDIVRWATPTVLAALTAVVANFENTLSKNTEAVYAMQTTLAVINEREQNMKGEIDENRHNIVTLTDDDNVNKREIQGLSLRLAAVDRGSNVR